MRSCWPWSRLDLLLAFGVNHLSATLASQLTTSITVIEGIALGSDQVGRLEGAAASQRGSAAIECGIECGEIGPSQLALRGTLQKAAAGCLYAGGASRSTRSSSSSGIEISTLTTSPYLVELTAAALWLGGLALQA